MKLIVSVLTVTFSLFIFNSVSGQEFISNVYDKDLLLKAKNSDRSEFKYIPKKPGHYTSEDWQEVIDATWGEGLPTETKLKIFDGFWNTIDRSYPSFFHIDVNWDSLRDVYRPEVAAGVSRGRFYAIMCRLNYSLQDVHTYIYDIPVAMDSLKPGIPLLVLSGYQSTLNKERLDIEYSHFGAGLSPLPDSSLLVYTTISDHPLGLQKGDVVLGYDGIPWKVLYIELLKAELPFAALPRSGSTPVSITHHLLTAAGENWHLFDTIDIVKYDTGDLVHLPTVWLQDQKMKLLATAQLPIPGVLFPDLDNGHSISWGLIEDTQIAYIYAWNWFVQGAFPGFHSTGEDFREAILALMNDHSTTGLIIDSRRNSGGNDSEWVLGLQLLFNQDQDIFRENRRDDPGNHFSMQVFSELEGFNYDRIEADDKLYDKPIAVLTGPASWSAGDCMPLQMCYHPMAKIFGLPTNAAFGITMDVWEIVHYYPDVDFFAVDISEYSKDWYFQLTISNECLWENPGEFLTHLSIPVDEEVWLTEEDVANGEDTVVKHALLWINNLAYAHDVKLQTNQPYLQPAIDSARITARVKNPNQHALKVEAIVKNDNDVITDTLALGDDGLNGDGTANDGLWGINITPMKEQEYRIYIRTTDEDEQTRRQLPDLFRFTSVEPVVLSYHQFLGDTISNPGEDIYLYLYLQNTSPVESVMAVTATLTCLDTFATVSSDYDSMSYNAIGPGMTKRSSGLYRISISDTEFPRNLYELHFDIDIYSDGYLFWKDGSLKIIVGIDEEDNALPKEFALMQNFPNPFNPKTTINYELPITSYIELSIFNILGEKVATLVSGKQKAGLHQVEWDASGFTSGVYYYHLNTEAGYSQTKKLVFIK